MFEIDVIPMLGCLPAAALAATSVAMSAGSSMLKYRSAKASAKATGEQQVRVGDQIIAQGAQNVSDIQARKQNTEEATARTKEEIARKSMVAASTSALSAMENGAGGRAFEVMTNEFLQRNAELWAATDTQLDTASKRLDREISMMDAHTRAKLTSNFRPINQPSAGAAVLEFGGEAIKTYGMYKGGAFGEPK